MAGFLPLILIFGLMYVLMIRPQQKKAKEQQARRQNSLNALLRKHKIQEHVEQMRISKRWDKLHEINRILEEDPMKAKRGGRGMRGSQSLPQLESP